MRNCICGWPVGMPCGEVSRFHSLVCEDPAHSVWCHSLGLGCQDNTAARPDLMALFLPALK